MYGKHRLVFLIVVGILLVLGVFLAASCKPEIKTHTVILMSEGKILDSEVVKQGDKFRIPVQQPPERFTLKSVTDQNGKEYVEGTDIVVKENITLTYNWVNPGDPSCTYYRWNSDWKSYHGTTNSVMSTDMKNPCPGRWDMKNMPREPLYWKMNEKQLSQFTYDLRNYWFIAYDYDKDKILNHFRLEGVIEGKEFKYYSTFHDGDWICQQVQIQHEDGSWENLWISKPIPVSEVR